MSAHGEAMQAFVMGKRWQVRTLDEVIVSAIEGALERHNWNQVAAAKELGISRRSLREKLKRAGRYDAEKFHRGNRRAAA